MVRERANLISKGRLFHNCGQNTESPLRLSLEFGNKTTLWSLDLKLLEGVYGCSNSDKEMGTSSCKDLYTNKIIFKSILDVISTQ